MVCRLERSDFSQIRQEGEQMTAADALRVLEEDELVAVIAVEDFHEVVKPVVAPSACPQDARPPMA